MRLIDADALKAELLGRIAFPDWVREAVLHIINNAPTVEGEIEILTKEAYSDLCLRASRERPQGEWIVGEYMDCHSDILPKYTCPFCGEVAYRKYDFCHCGADMRGERHHNAED